MFVFLDAYFRAEVFLMLMFMLKFFDAYFRFFFLILRSSFFDVYLVFC